jgi:hypothetical protein
MPLCNLVLGRWFVEFVTAARALSVDDPASKISSARVPTTVSPRYHPGCWILLIGTRAILRVLPIGAERIVGSKPDPY